MNRTYVTSDMLCVVMEEYKVNYAYTEISLGFDYWIV